MIIKSHIRGGFRDAAAYLKEQGKNEYTRLVEMSDPHVKNLDEAFQAMWAVSDGTKVKKPLHHVSINPPKDERLTDRQVRRICERLEERYGYAHGEHQRVIVEHIKDGRQHFHVMWNRVNLKTGKPHYPYMHKKQSKIAAREMEAELGLKRPVPRRKTRSNYAPRKSRVKVSNSAKRVGFPKRPNSRFVTRSTGICHHVRPKPIRPDTPVAPVRPMLSRNTGGMCAAQRADFIAACEGKITWAQYFQKWGGGGSNLRL
jgi:hypothetical protein